MKNIYSPVNECIYCGKTDCKLTDEHIIPECLGGEEILPKSSCVECQKITSKIENVMKDTYRPLRSYLNMPSKHKNLPKEIKYKVKENGDTHYAEVPINEATIFFPVFNFEEPTCKKWDFSAKGINCKVEIRSIGKQLNDLQHERSFSELEYGFKAKIADFARMLAKIAYAYVVAKNGLPLYRNSQILQSILGHTNDIGIWVGSETTDCTSSTNELIVEIKEFDNPRTSKNYILVKIHFLCNLGFPIYKVIIPKNNK